MESKLTTAELTNLIHMRSRQMMPLVTEVIPLNHLVYYRIGSRQFVANCELDVLEVANGKVFDSIHSQYQQGLLRGGKRDDEGNLIGEQNAAG